MKYHNCRVCGLYFEEQPWGEDNQTPSYEICPCCGVEFGYEDYTYESAKAYRAKWLGNGAHWFLPKQKPEDWNLTRQLKHIPEEFI